MSHFTCLVIGPDHEKQLQPFHEFECTGIDDEYVKDIDITDEARETYAKSTESRLKARDGTLHSFYDATGNWRPEFSRPDPNAQSFDRNRRTKFVPEGFKEVRVPTSEVETFAEWAEDYYGRTVSVVDGVEKLIKHTNPNAKWDWWTVGGRWSGFLKLKPGAQGLTGETGVMDSHFAKGADRADQARKGDIDFDGMRDQAGEKAGALWDKAHKLTGGTAWESWDAVRERVNPIDAARLFYQGQAAVIALKTGDHQAFGWGIDDALSGSRESYVQRARDEALATFAVLSRGEWTERGRMGWWACVSDEMEEGRWYQLFNDMLDGLPDDTLLTVVDCHI